MIDKWGTFSDALFYLEQKGISKDEARDFVLRLFGWGVDAAIDRMRPTRPAPPDAPAVAAQLPLGEEVKPKTKREPKKAAHRIPEDFEMKPEHRAFAAERAFTPTEIDSMWLKFKNHFLGSTEISPDWTAKWRTWVMRGVDFKNRDNQNRKPDHIDGRL